MYLESKSLFTSNSSAAKRKYESSVHLRMILCFRDHVTGDFLFPPSHQSNAIPVEYHFLVRMAS